MTRILTAVVGILLLLALTIWGPSWGISILVLIVAALALDEFLGMVTVRGERCPGRWLIVPALGTTASFALGLAWVPWILVADLLILSIVSMASGRGTEHLEYVAFGMAGILYTGLLPGFLLLTPSRTLWVLFAIVWAGDTLAFYGGRTLGRHRLAPVLSPNKTVEGSLAGALGSVFVGALVGRYLIDLTLADLLLICLLTGLAGQLGDLTESAIKRTAGVKDSANRLPGHGGVLDRVDSLLFAAPVFQFLLMWVS